MPIDLLAELANPANPAKTQAGQGTASANSLLNDAKPAQQHGGLAEVSAELAAGDALRDKPLSGISKVSGQEKPDYITHPERYAFPSFTISTAAGTFSFQMAVQKVKYDPFAILEKFQCVHGSDDGKL